MAFAGYLIKVGGSAGTVFPMEYIKASEYAITPDQRMETEAKRDTEGYLHRTTVAHTASKIEFSTPVLTNLQHSALMALLRNNYSDPLKREILLEYYDTDTDTYKEGTFYVPDIQHSIDHIDLGINMIYYNPMTIKFIEN